MNNNTLKAISVAAIVLVVLSLVPLGRTQAENPAGYTSSFLLLNKVEGDQTYELNLTIPQMLFQYYAVQNHALYSLPDFKKFVTPYTMKPIADRLWQIYDNKEDFTNGVLMLVHQITYKEVIPGKYPIETLVNGYGDCDLFAFIAASILEAGGIPAVLLYYKDKLHMEIGVDLDAAPKEARVDTFNVKYQNVTYYIGECTGDKWRTGWRIGETPIEYQNSTPQVVTLETSEQTSIGQVTATIRELDPSRITLQVSSLLTLENQPITISGQILPEVTGENVTLRAQNSNRGWITIGTVQTSNDGRFTYSWVPLEDGPESVQASWEGTNKLNGASSTQANVFVMPFYLLALITTAVMMVVLVTSMFMVTRKRKTKAIPLQTPPPEPPQNLPAPPQEPEHSGIN
jgi:hypothetical protein